MYLKHSTITGDFSKGDTPVLIPNTEVKTFSAENTCLETSREHRSLPVFQLREVAKLLFFLFLIICIINVIINVIINFIINVIYR